MRRLGGKEVGDAILASLAPKIEELGKKGVVPTLGVLRVGAREDDLAYERGLKKKFESAGCGVRVVELPADVSQEDLDKGFDSLNDADDIHGILVFRPLPKGLSDSYMRSAITKTVDLPGECRNADIIVACCGVAKTIGPDYLKEGQIVIDVGMNVDEEGKLCGDVDYDKAYEIAEAVTPVPGGVGSVTTSVLLKHVVESCDRA